MNTIEIYLEIEKIYLHYCYIRNMTAIWTQVQINE